MNENDLHIITTTVINNITMLSYDDMVGLTNAIKIEDKRRVVIASTPQEIVEIASKYIQAGGDKNSIVSSVGDL